MKMWPHVCAWLPLQPVTKRRSMSPLSTTTTTTTRSLLLFLLVLSTRWPSSASLRPPPSPSSGPLPYRVFISEAVQTSHSSSSSSLESSSESSSSSSSASVSSSSNNNDIVNIKNIPNNNNNNKMKNNINAALQPRGWDTAHGGNYQATRPSWMTRRSAPSPMYRVVASDGSPANEAADAPYNWPFRIALLTISMACVLLTLILGFYVHKYRRQKVIKFASPIFLYITLLGCVVMYFEMAAIFPILSTRWCVATKITRHLGVCLVFSALLLKTWRVSLTFRVKSAHKLKLTDKQLLSWLFPIVLVMGVYLGAWTISDPPNAEYILAESSGLRFKQCQYGWWDHSLAIGELFFLLWGIKVCWNVRNAESFFNEAKYITWAIYNITLVNLTMIAIHVFIFPNAGPDTKYLFGFLRTQLSTTTTILIVFAPKFWRIARGEGDKWDHGIRNPVIAATFGLNGVGGLVGGGVGGIGGVLYDDGVDVYQENEELKEQITKLATQIEIMKIMYMEMNNRHLKQKHHTLAVHAALAAPASDMIKVVSAHPKGQRNSSTSGASGPAPVPYRPALVASSHHGSISSIHHGASPIGVGVSEVIIGGNTSGPRAGSMTGVVISGGGMSPPHGCGGTQYSTVPRDMTVTTTATSTSSPHQTYASGHVTPEYSLDRSYNKKYKIQILKESCL